MKKLLLYMGLLAVLFLAGCSSKLAENDLKDDSETVNGEKMKDILLEAEEATLLGNTAIIEDANGFTGSGYVTNFHNTGDGVSFMITVEQSGPYDLIFSLNSSGDKKVMDVIVDGGNMGSITVQNNGFIGCWFEKVWLDAGTHTIDLMNGWGYVDLDSLTVSQTDMVSNSVYTSVTSKLCNPNATQEAENLYKYLLSIYGKKTLIGQHPANYGMYSREFQAIKKAFGETPALMELDFMNYSGSRIEYGGEDDVFVEQVKQFAEKGGIIAVSWHWNAPSKYLYNTADKPWYSGFYTYATSIDIEKIMSGDDVEGYNLLLEDIDRVAEKIKELQEANIPIIFRPLHEASGGWFWWGAKGSIPCVELYRMLYDRLVNYHQLNNIIWMWNGDEKEWYPGDDYVDLVSTDIYAAEYQYSAQLNNFLKVYNASGGTKMVVLAESGVMIDPDLMKRDNVHWLFICSWCGNYVVSDEMIIQFSEKYTELRMAEKVYQSDDMITLSTLPDWKNGVFE